VVDVVVDLEVGFVIVVVGGMSSGGLMEIFVVEYHYLTSDFINYLNSSCVGSRINVIYANNTTDVVVFIVVSIVGVGEGQLKLLPPTSNIAASDPWRLEEERDRARTMVEVVEESWCWCVSLLCFHPHD
jgi:hypothetical protein